MNIEASIAVLVESILKLFFLSVIGYLAVRFRLLSENNIKMASKIVITVTLPCLIIATLGTQLSNSVLETLAHTALASFMLITAAISIALLFRAFFIGRNQKNRRLFVSLSSMHNAGYLPIPLAAAVLPQELRSHGLLLIFVFIMVMGSIFWTLGVWLVTEGTEKNWKETIKKIANPPIAAMFAGLLFLIPQVKEGFLSAPYVEELLTFVGNTTIPLVMIVLGGAFGQRLPVTGDNRRIIGISSLLKLFVIPAMVLIMIKIFALENVFGFILLLEASMPAALNHIVVAREYGGNLPLNARALFIQYALSLITIPFFLFIFNAM